VAARTSAAPITRDFVEQVVREAVEKRLRAGGGQQTSCKTSCQTCPKPCSKAGATPSELVVHASARHVHLSRADLDTLFGAGHELTPDKQLYQEGNYAAAETVTIVGPRSRLIANVRVLGPLRKQSQIELAFTDAILLGIDAPVRLSGNIDGTPGAVLMGPKGVIELRHGVIRAAIHVHMNPAEATHYGATQGDLMKLRVAGPATVVFEGVHVRIDPSSRLNVHMDTDEANACALHLATGFELFK
jgi:putative phosphotransacetylase